MELLIDKIKYNLDASEAENYIENNSITLLKMEEQNALFLCAYSEILYILSIDFNNDNKAIKAIFSSYKEEDNNNLYFIGELFFQIANYYLINHKNNIDALNALDLRVRKIATLIRKSINKFDEFSPCFIDIILLSLTKKEINAKAESILKIKNTLNRIIQADSTRFISIAYSLANRLDLNEQEIEYITNKIFTISYLSSLSTSASYLIEIIISILKDEQRKAFTNAITNTVLSIYYYYTRDYLIEALIPVLMRNGLLNKKIIKSYLENDRMHCIYKSQVVKYCLNHELYELIPSIDNEQFDEFDDVLKKEYLTYLFKNEPQEHAYRLANHFVATTSTFQDYLFYKQLNIPSNYSLSSRILINNADTHNYLAAIYVYNNNKVSVAELKKLSLNDFIFLKDKLITNYKNETIESLKTNILKKSKLKKIQCDYIERGLLLLKEFSPIEYGKIRNEISVKNIIINSPLIRSDDILSMKKNKQLENHKIYIYNE